MTTDSAGSVTCWIDALKGDAGDGGLDDAARQLWGRYCDRLVRLAKDRLRRGSGPPPGVVDEEDVALSAFHTLCKMAAAGRFPKLDDRDDLWKLLVTLTARKAANERKSARRKKRGGGLVLDEAALNGNDPDGDAMARVIGDEPTPEFAAMISEEFRRLVASLREPEFVKIAMMKFEGHTNLEIADDLGCVERTVERKLKIIRKTWVDAAVSPGDGRNDESG